MGSLRSKGFPPSPLHGQSIHLCQRLQAGMGMNSGHMSYPHIMQDLGHTIGLKTIARYKEQLGPPCRSRFYTWTSEQFYQKSSDKLIIVGPWGFTFIGWRVKILPDPSSVGPALLVDTQRTQQRQKRFLCLHYCRYTGPKASTRVCAISSSHAVPVPISRERTTRSELVNHSAYVSISKRGEGSDRNASHIRWNISPSHQEFTWSHSSPQGNLSDWAHPHLVEARSSS